MSQRFGITSLIAAGLFASFEEFMAAPTPPAPPSVCIICKEPITDEWPNDRIELHADGVAHERCRDSFVDKVLTEHPPRGYKPPPRGKR